MEIHTYPGVFTSKKMWKITMGGFPRSGFMIYKWWVDAIGPVCAHGMEFRRILVGGIPTIVVNILLIMVNIWLLYG